MRKITIEKIPECEEWCELGTQLDASWKGGWLDLISNNNGHRQESEFDNENEHCHLHTHILRTFLVQLYEQK